MTPDNNIDRWVYDIECYRNFFLVVFVNVRTRQSQYWARFNDQISWDLEVPEGTLISFNGIHYDHPMLSAARLGNTNAQLKQLNDNIITFGLKSWDHEHLIDDRDHIDIIQVLPGIASLKIYGGRIGYRKLQDLPVHFDKQVSREEANTLTKYCVNDCMVTLELAKKIEPQLDLRRNLSAEYGLDLRSKSDAQIAEAVICSQYEMRSGQRAQKPQLFRLLGSKTKYNPPDFIKFESEQLRTLLTGIKDCEFEISKSSGKVSLPPWITRQHIKLGKKSYKMGVGGLHSIDGPGSYCSSDTNRIVDIDVASYYPAIILNCCYEPEQMRGYFLNIYKDLVDRRLAAKKSGDKVTADSLKITINGSFGKLGSKWSKLYAPYLMLHVTITGQLALLMLIEKLGDHVISANTDGITVDVPMFEQLSIDREVSDWEKATKFVMEETEYKSVHIRDVNNYFAIKRDGEIKKKGIFKPGGLMKNPTNEVIPRAVIEHFKTGMPIDLFILTHSKLLDFTALRTVNGGAKKDGIAYGKSIRWYWSNRPNATAVHYDSDAKAGDTVPLTDHSSMLMDLPKDDEEFPDDLDYDRYIGEATKLAELIRGGQMKKKKMNIRPITLKAAKEFILRHHRHSKPPTGHKFSIGLESDDVLIGVACAGRPVARFMDDGLTIEVNRTCTTGEKNANSMLYGAVWRCARAMGYKKAITYTQFDESGASLRGAGWYAVQKLPPRKSWAESSVKLKHAKDPIGAGNVERIRWEIESK